MLPITIFHGFSSHVNISFLVSKQGKHGRGEYIYIYFFFVFTGTAEYLLFARPFFRNYFPREILLLPENIFTHSPITYWAVTQAESKTWKTKEIWPCLSRCSYWCGSLVVSRTLFRHHVGGGKSLLWRWGHLSNSLQEWWACQKDLVGTSECVQIDENSVFHKTFWGRAKTISMVRVQSLSIPDKGSCYSNFLFQRELRYAHVCLVREECFLWLHIWSSEIDLSSPPYIAYIKGRIFYWVWGL